MGRIYASNSATSLAPFARLLIFINVMQLSKRFSLKIKIKFAAIFQPNSAWIKFELNIKNDHQKTDVVEPYVSLHHTNDSMPIYFYNAKDSE